MKEKIKVAFQGEMGAYSHLAILEIIPNAEVQACPTFEETFMLAYKNSQYKIIIPIENSLAGRVADIHFLIPKYKLQIHKTLRLRKTISIAFVLLLLNPYVTKVILSNLEILINFGLKYYQSHINIYYEKPMPVTSFYNVYSNVTITNL